MSPRFSILKPLRFYGDLFLALVDRVVVGDIAGSICFMKKLKKNVVGIQQGAAQQAAPQEAGRTYGYIRVSSREQNEARQVVALQEFGVDRVFMDKQSGKDFNRPANIQLMETLQHGDTLVIKSIRSLGPEL